MLKKSVNPEKIVNFAIPFGEKSERSGKALAFFREPEKSPNNQWTHRKKDLRSSVLSFCIMQRGHALPYAYRRTERAFILSFSFESVAFGDAFRFDEEDDEVLSFLVSEPINAESGGQ